MLSKVLTSITLKWTLPGSVQSGTKVIRVADIGAIKARQEAAKRAAQIHEKGGTYIATEFYANGSWFEFKNT